MALLKLLSAARWLSTSQVHRRFFPAASKDTASKRLCKLTRARYLIMVQHHPMREALYTLGVNGKRTLERDGAVGLAIERRPPKQWEHFFGINNIRLAAERDLPLSYFFASWELPAVRWPYSIIPDAVFATPGQSFAVEYDRGLESVRYFVHTKMAAYRRELEDFRLSAILVVTDSTARMMSIAKAMRGQPCRLLYTTLDLIDQQGLAATIFSEDPAQDRTLPLLAGPRSNSPHARGGFLP